MSPVLIQVIPAVAALGLIFQYLYEGNVIYLRATKKVVLRFTTHKTPTQDFSPFFFFALESVTTTANTVPGISPTPGESKKQRGSQDITSLLSSSKS